MDRRSRLLARLFAVCGILLLPWIGLMIWQLHGQAGKRGFSSAWVGLDLIEVAGLLAVAFLARARLGRTAPGPVRDLTRVLPGRDQRLNEGSVRPAGCRSPRRGGGNRRTRSLAPAGKGRLAMTGNERDVRIRQRANRILSDDDAVVAYARFVDAQLRYRRVRNMLARLRALVRVLMVAVLALLSACVLGPAPGPAPGAETTLRNWP